MNNPTDTTTPQDSASPVGLRMCKQMSVPGVCRGALTCWPQLQAAIAQLNQTDPSRPALPTLRGVPSAAQVGGPKQLCSALAIAPGLLQAATPPTDLYGRFAWLTLRVYEGARTIQATLQELPALVDSTAGNRAEGGALVKEALTGAGGLSQRARTISMFADSFAAQLHTFTDSVNALNGQAGSSAAAAQDAEKTVLSVVGNMTLAVETLSTAWQTTMTQFDTVANGDPRQLGNVDYLQTNLQVDPAAQEWGSFAEIIQSFTQGLLVEPPASASLRMVR